MTRYRDQLVKLCGRPGYSRSGVGISAGFNKNYVSDIISGKITPTVDKLESLAVALEVPLEVLLFGEQGSGEVEKIASRMMELNPESRRAVVALVDTLANQQDASKGGK